ncbi:MAG: WecB/TagA/CpsF family glycosyltransferase [Candidatus Moraniibacteriota bacterium]
MKLLNIQIDNLSRQEILEKIEFFLQEDCFYQVATINPEFLLEAQKDAEFKNILNSCSLNVADGIGIGYAFLRFGKILKTRFAGVDLTQEILQLANTQKLSVFLAINSTGLSSYKEISKILSKEYPQIIFSGDTIDKEFFSSYKILDTRYKILLCNFGAPWQEKFLSRQKNAKIRLAMGVGGSFDFLTGKLKRAPKLFQQLGLEWFWRLAQEPKYRWKRICRAVLVFPFKIIFSKNSND